MSTTGIYLNFERQTEAAFQFYKIVFGGDFVDKISRFRDIPEASRGPIAEADLDLVMHVGLPILGGTLLMGTDAPESMGFSVSQGNNVYINLMPDSKEEADRLFNALTDGGTIEMPMQEMFWGDYYGSLRDKFGINWMINYSRN